jgi:hypothetical protein
MAKKTKKNKKTNAFMNWISIRNNQIALIFGLPITGWFIGIVINPSGWLSDFSGFLILLLSVPIAFWYISIPLIAYLIYLKVKKKQAIFSVVLFCISVLYGLVIAISTSSADEDEFA